MLCLCPSMGKGGISVKFKSYNTLFKKRKNYIEFNFKWNYANEVTFLL
jgi:hypothetical protein